MSEVTTPAAPAAPAAPAPVPAAPAPAPAPAAAPPPAAPAPAAAPEQLIAAPPPAPEPVPEVEFKVPEGVTADDEVVKAFKPLAKELGLKSEGAQKLVDLYAGVIQKANAAAEAAFVKQQGEWAESLKSDKELGGANFDATKVEVARFFGTFDQDGSIRREIAALGLGNNPALVRLAVRAAKAIGEDSMAGREASAGSTPDPEANLRLRYPTMFKD